MEGPTQSFILTGVGDDEIHLTTGGENDLVVGSSGDDSIIVENAIGEVVLTNHCFPPIFDFTVWPFIETQPGDKIIFRNPDLTKDEITITCDDLVAAGIGWQLFVMNTNPPGEYRIDLVGVHWRVCRLGPITGSDCLEGDLNGIIDLN